MAQVYGQLKESCPWTARDKDAWEESRRGMVGSHKATALVDGAAECVARVLALQFGFTVKLAERGIDTYATLAFAINFTSGGDDAVIVNTLAIPSLR